VGPAVEAEWNVFTHKIVRSSGATILPVHFTGQNSRAFQIANQLGDTLRQGLLLYEIKRACSNRSARSSASRSRPAS
jgi:putative hemolysin